MSQHLRGLRRQRDRGRMRVALVTTGGAAGAAALATLFGAVLWTGQSESAPRIQPGPAVQQAQPDQPAQEAAGAAAGGAKGPAGNVVAAADVAPTATGSSTPTPLGAPASQPKNTGKQRPHASSGGS